MLSRISPLHSEHWKSLQTQYQRLSKTTLRSLFTTQKERFQRFSLSHGPLLLDYSKNHITEEVMELLCKLSTALKLPEAKEAFFSGEKINATENRSVLHHTLRAPSRQAFNLSGTNIAPQIAAEKEKMRLFCDKLHSHTLLGCANKPITTIVNIGIGGSDLGSRMVCAALRPFHKKGVRVYFVSNLDSADLLDTLEKCDPAHTFFLISSKSFRTAETMANAEQARSWFLRKTGKKEAIGKHFGAISAAKGPATGFGIPEEHIFRIWNWVGGRFSLWSSVGLPIACAIGFKDFEKLLAGAHEMDQHFFQSPPHANMPTILALLSLWYSNFFDAHTHAVICYADRLRHFVPFLQQMSMESNGKSTSRADTQVEYATAPVLWGGIGTNGQHSFHQFLHQGTRIVPCDFIIPAQAEHPYPLQHRQLIAHGLAQSHSLMYGQSAEDWRKELKTQGLSEESIAKSAVHRSCTGNRPSNTILIERIEPKSLGALIALYEHKVFVEGILWNIHSFDQWGVELGKEIAIKMETSLSCDEKSTEWEASTRGLIEYVQKNGV